MRPRRPFMASARSVELRSAKSSFKTPAHRIFPSRESAEWEPCSCTSRSITRTRHTGVTRMACSVESTVRSKTAQSFQLQDMRRRSSTRLRKAVQSNDDQEKNGSLGRSCICTGTGNCSRAKSSVAFLVIAVLACLAFPSLAAAQAIQTVAGNGSGGYSGDGGSAPSAELK